MFGLTLTALLPQISLHMFDVSTVLIVIKFCVNINVANTIHQHFVNMHNVEYEQNLNVVNWAADKVTININI
jgi:ABC-type siderophore export system fused ATPase/permease subunit